MTGNMDFLISRYVSAALTLSMVIACAPEPEKVDVPAYPTVIELATMLKAGQATSTEIVTELLQREVQAEGLNAYISVDAAQALARAKELDAMRAAGNTIGLLHGIPFVVKDNIHVAGLPNTAGTPALSEFVPTSDSPVVANLKAAGAIVLAKANMHELAFGITSDNHAFGAVTNPYNTSMFAGGSSGGTASAVSGGLAPIGLGTDTGGSVRIPAALTGVVGYRPSTGRYDSSAVTPISHTRDTVGLIARTVTGVALFDSAIVGKELTTEQIRPTEIRLGVPRSFYYANLDAQSTVVVDTALARLADAGITLVDADPADVEDLLAKTAFPIALYEVKHDLPEYLHAHDVGVTFSELAAGVASPDVQGIMSLVGSDPITTDVYAGALEAREELREVFAAYFNEHELDAMIFPTTLLPARPLANSQETVELDGEQVPTFPTYIHNTDSASIAALPGISLPIGLTASGLPVGIEIDGPERSDEKLLEIALTLETIFEFTAQAAADN